MKFAKPVVCPRCKRSFVRNAKSRKYCVPCSIFRYAEVSRNSMRRRKRRSKGMYAIRKKLEGIDWHKCQVCGYDEVVDLHHEGDLLYALCPNHHALITRGKQEIKDYNIKPIEKECP